AVCPPGPGRGGATCRPGARVVAGAGTDRSRDADPVAARAATRRGYTGGIADRTRASCRNSAWPQQPQDPVELIEARGVGGQRPPALFLLAGGARPDTP